ncbi:MAG: hypothetical protein WED00_12345 [Aquisalimonadaceae bacterium]
MTAAATLNLVAEMDRILKIKRNIQYITCIPPRHKVVRQIFEQVGLSWLLGLSLNEPVVAKDVRCWRFVSSDQADGAIPGELLSEFRDHLHSDLTPSLFRAVTEAMANAVEHSHSCARIDSLPALAKRWWMFAGVFDNQLVFVICDLGVGIPNALPVRWHERMINRVISRLRLGTTDGDYIRAAMEITKTRTQLPHRGKGMTQLRDVLTEAQGGTLVVYSNKGAYTYQPAEEDGEHIEGFKTPLGGTTIEWSLPLHLATSATVRGGQDERARNYD